MAEARDVAEREREKGRVLLGESRGVCGRESWVRGQQVVCSGQVNVCIVTIVPSPELVTLGNTYRKISKSGVNCAMILFQYIIDPCNGCHCFCFCFFLASALAFYSVKSMCPISSSKTQRSKEGGFEDQYRSWYSFPPF